MTPSHRSSPPGARAIAGAVDDAVTAAQAADEPTFLAAANRVAACDAEQVRVVLGSVVRALLEDLHPEGLTGDDVQQTLERCVRANVGWFPELDVAALIVVITGALGVHDPDDPETPRLTPLDVARHAPLLLNDLLVASGSTLAPYLDSALADVARHETQEMP